MNIAPSRGRSLRPIIDELRPRLSAAGIELELGRPASSREIDALAERLGIRLPDQFRTFLEEIGGLRVIAKGGQERRFLGPDELPAAQVELAEEFVSWRGEPAAADDELLEEFETWGGLPLRAVPIVTTRGPLSCCNVLNFAGQVCEFYRGALELRPESFAQLLKNSLWDFVEGHKPGGLLDVARIAQEQVRARLRELENERALANVLVEQDESFAATRERIRAIETKALRGLRTPAAKPSTNKAKPKAKAKPKRKAPATKKR